MMLLKTCGAIIARVDEGALEGLQRRLEEQLRRDGVGFAGMAECQQDEPENGTDEERS